MQNHRPCCKRLCNPFALDDLRRENFRRKIQNAVDIRTEQQRVQLEISIIREEEGQAIPQTKTSKENLVESIQTDMDNKILESNRFFPLMEEEASSEENEKSLQIIEGSGLNDLIGIKTLTSSSNLPTSRK
ncbi:hypothetical protein CHS0354_029378 [Potamilus streckersoni]|uniref:Uncharacterized protein n=1 Tax=Potamilus streckersoni TaxID=2493646 RepID=A0AAE0STJ6_9BIVA|nr:hypothetical protein CHS0354_029378 [Potamilus streckersoni]